MKFGERKYKTVFLLGAGATRGAISHVLHNQKRIKPPLNGDFFKIAEAYARGEGQRSAAQSRLKRLRGVFKRDLPLKSSPTMEEAFSLLYVAKAFPDIYNKGQGRRRVAGERREIDDFLHLLFSVLSLLDSGNQTVNGYDRLVDKLTPGDTVLTLNYDTLLDSALHRRGWDPSDGYAISLVKRNVTWSKNVLEDDQRGLEVELIKLHGSMNWFVRGSTSKLSKVFSSNPFASHNPASTKSVASFDRLLRQSTQKYSSTGIGKIYGPGRSELSVTRR